MTGCSNLPTFMMLYVLTGLSSRNLFTISFLLIYCDCLFLNLNSFFLLFFFARDKFYHCNYDISSFFLPLEMNYWDFRYNISMKIQTLLANILKVLILLNLILSIDYRTFMRFYNFINKQILTSI